MTAKKQQSDRRSLNADRWDALSFVPYRRSRDEIVSEAIAGLKKDLREAVKLTLDA